MERGVSFAVGPGVRSPSHPLLRGGFAPIRLRSRGDRILPSTSGARSARRELVPLCVRAGALLYRIYVFSGEGSKPIFILKFEALRQKERGKSR